MHSTKSNISPLMQARVASLTRWTLIAATPFASWGAALSAFAADQPAYAGLKPDEFMKRWLILKPIPVAPSKQGEPDEAAQKKAFAEDLLTGAGGEAKVRPA